MTTTGPTKEDSQRDLLITRSNVCIRKDFAWEAAHRLENHDGKCARLHGHSYRAQVELAAPYEKLITDGPKRGMLIDFADLTRTVKALVIAPWDHRFLYSYENARTTIADILRQEEKAYLQLETSTAEMLALDIARRLITSPIGQYLERVIVWETANSSAIWTRSSTKPPFDKQ